MQNADDIFELARPRLTGLAYRLLGTMAEAEDAVQDTFLRWLSEDRQAIRNPQAWLTRVCTNRCLDMMKSATRQRTDYIGPWLPEPLHTAVPAAAEQEMVLADSLSTAFLMLLERLKPGERAAFLLHEVFGQPHGDVAETLGVTAASSRQLVSRARKRLGTEAPPSVVAVDQHHAFLDMFQRAIREDAVELLDELLSRDVELHADGGGKVLAARRVLAGPDRVLRFLKAVVVGGWQDLVVQPSDINGSPGLIAFSGDRIAAVLTLRLGTDHRTDRIYIMRNPDKLRRLGQASPWRVTGTGISPSA